MKTWLWRGASLLASAIAASLLASVVQTQHTLAGLAAIGVDVPLGDRLDATLHDLAGFGPNFAALALGAFLVAFPVTGLLRRWLPERRAALYAFAGGVAIAVMLQLMELALGLPGIAAARDLAGFSLLVACGVAGGGLFATLSARAPAR